MWTGSVAMQGNPWHTLWRVQGILLPEEFFLWCAYAFSCELCVLPCRATPWHTLWRVQGILLPEVFFLWCAYAFSCELCVLPCRATPWHSLWRVQAGAPSHMKGLFWTLCPLASMSGARFSLAPKQKSMRLRPFSMRRPRFWEGSLQESRRLWKVRAF